ncbi:hypothetical protein [Dyella caseinilytica]|uniref:Uncharacterized protein n=1 Tax=Dyella caseinilytica TaxID=1849581 RepID=A0ABX7GPS5_9GAMM|nr:hypothetical protein [Dyella caseinilytica]QRN52420.1 hypothetical protein ISN74_13135 [Dyella caseinilytica]GGA05820.1 hypothetical protein GCM10011408_28470 [Dyella caseinilytica]
MNAHRTYTATFADGTTIRRGTFHEYKQAWRIRWISGGVERVKTGFSRDPFHVPQLRMPHHVGTGITGAARKKNMRLNREWFKRANVRRDYATPELVVTNRLGKSLDALMSSTSQTAAIAALIPITEKAA